MRNRPVKVSDRTFVLYWLLQLVGTHIPDGCTRSLCSSCTA
ncbi:2Fe-2S iron-sulfur cluster-binding protein [Paenibacillus terreus]|uniref:2Fe-2S iron-sulfur cluster-binding protein n=1 Tax=Paenibacillus terreus TaxID=1387834 RepID=A0ABV5BD94_9BACL